eukprot:1545734-Rhodomonas_salina.1
MTNTSNTKVLAKVISAHKKYLNLKRLIDRVQIVGLAEPKVKIQTEQYKVQPAWAMMGRGPTSKCPLLHGPPPCGDEGPGQPPVEPVPGPSSRCP